MLRRFIKYLIRIRKTINWKLQSRRVASLYKNENAQPFCITDEEVVIIAPHADDELIGCHQLITNYTQSITVLYGGYLGSNQTESNRITREQEIKKYCQMQGCNLVVSTPKTIGYELKRVIRERVPQFIFLPSYVDWHDEHRLVNDVLIENFEEYKGHIAWYHVSMPIPGRFINAYSAMSKEQNNSKWDLMKQVYISQLHMDINRFRFVEKINGKPEETYFVLDKNEYKEAVNAFKEIGVKKMHKLKSALGDISKMYELTNSIYQSI